MTLLKYHVAGMSESGDPVQTFVEIESGQVFSDALQGVQWEDENGFYVYPTRISDLVAKQFTEEE